MRIILIEQGRYWVEARPGDRYLQEGREFFLKLISVSSMPDWQQAHAKMFVPVCNVTSKMLIYINNQKTVDIAKKIA
ncbi:MAG: hypothetical protein LBV29_00335 [Azoarcus sp.]|jgi:hypothetical protein|nr:hypothetical protein [Azoarcus sp.]